MLNYLPLHKDHQACIDGVAREMGTTRKDVGYFLIEMAIATIIAQKDGSEKQKAAIDLFLKSDHGKKMSEILIRAWKEGGDRLREMQ